MKAMTSTPTPRVMMTVREAVHHILSESKDSLSAAEIRVRYVKLTGRRLDPAGALKEINNLIKQGKVFARTETTKERFARAGGELVKGRLAKLYSTKNPVPKRTGALDDIVLGDGQATAFRGEQQPAASTKVVDEVASLVKRLAQLEAQLAEARRVVSK